MASSGPPGAVHEWRSPLTRCCSAVAYAFPFLSDGRRRWSRCWLPVACAAWCCWYRCGRQTTRESTVRQRRGHYSTEHYATQDLLGPLRLLARRGRARKASCGACLAHPRDTVCTFRSREPTNALFHTQNGILITQDWVMGRHCRSSNQWLLRLEKIQRKTKLAD